MKEANKNNPLGERSPKNGGFLSVSKITNRSVEETYTTASRGKSC